MTFNEESLAVGLAYGQLTLGLKVPSGISFAAEGRVPTAIIL
jgi:hypothetical protein